MKNSFRISAAITKIDEESRTIEGVATAEVLDKQGEIVDYEAAKAAITGTWPGNLREMHKAEAVGTGVVVACDDATKTIRIRATISKGAPNTWEKVKDGTLKMFSIGGQARERIAEKVGDVMARRMFLGSCHEISVVDNGACPGAAFAIAKIADGKVEDLEGDEPIDISKGIAGNPKPYQVTQAAALISALNELLSDLVWDANYAAQDGGEVTIDPAKLAEIELVKGAVNSLLQFLNSRFAGQFPAAAEGEAPAVEVVVETDEVANVRLASITKAALALIKHGVEKAGARHSKKDQDMIQGVHDQAVALGGTCTKPEAEATDDDAAKIATAIKASGLAAAGIVSLQVLDKDGKPIGEVIRIGDPAAAPAAKAVESKTGEVVVKIADLPEVQQLVDGLRAEGEVNKATMTAQAATITGLTEKLDLVTKRLETVEAQPAAGGPAVRVAEKQVLANGEQPAATGALTAEALSEVIKQLPDGPAKDTLLVKLHSMNVAAGVGVTVIGGRPTA